MLQYHLDPIMSFPENVKLSGLKFMWQGWNTTYYKTSEVSDGCPVYRLDPYTLYWFIDIIGAKLYRKDGVWVFQRDFDFGPFKAICKYGVSPQNDPFGHWSSGARVEPA